MHCQTLLRQSAILGTLRLTVVGLLRAFLICPLPNWWALMSDQINVGNIGIHQVTKDNITCKVTDHDTFSCITLDFGLTSVTLFTSRDDVAAIRRILGGW